MNSLFPLGNNHVRWTKGNTKSDVTHIFFATLMGFIIVQNWSTSVFFVVVFDQWIAHRYTVSMYVWLHMRISCVAPTGAQFPTPAPCPQATGGGAPGGAWLRTRPSTPRPISHRKEELPLCSPGNGFVDEWEKLTQCLCLYLFHNKKNTHRQFTKLPGCQVPPFWWCYKKNQSHSCFQAYFTLFIRFLKFVRFLIYIWIISDVFLPFWFNSYYSSRWVEAWFHSMC